MWYTWLYTLKCLITFILGCRIVCILNCVLEFSDLIGVLCVRVCLFVMRSYDYLYVHWGVCYLGIFEKLVI